VLKLKEPPGAVVLRYSWIRLSVTLDSTMSMRPSWFQSMANETPPASGLAVSPTGILVALMSPPSFRKMPLTSEL